MTRLLTITLLLLCATGWGQQLNKGFIQTYPQQVTGLGGFVSVGADDAVIEWNVDTIPIPFYSSPLGDIKDMMFRNIVYRNGTYYLYEENTAADPLWAISLRQSTDGIHFPLKSANILTKGATGTFYANGVADPTVIIDSDTDWKMYTDAINGASAWDSLGYATSNNGTTWTMVAPVIGRGGVGAWDHNSVHHPVCVKYNGTYYLYYSGSDAGPIVKKIGLATSTDGRHFTKYAQNPVLSPGTSGQWDDYYLRPSRPFKIGNTWYMLYWGNSGAAHGMGLAISPDLYNWTKVGKMLGDSTKEYYHYMKDVAASDVLVKHGSDIDDYIVQIWYHTYSPLATYQVSTHIATLAPKVAGGTYLKGFTTCAYKQAGDSVKNTSFVSNAANYIYVYKITLGTEMTPDAIKVYFGAWTKAWTYGQIKLALYSDQSGTPKNYITTTETKDFPSIFQSSWNIFNFTTPPSLSAGNYWIAVWSSAAYSQSKTAGGSNNHGNVSSTFGAWPSSVTIDASYGYNNFDACLIYTRPNVWRIDLASEPNSIYFNGIKGNKQLSISGVSSEYSWYWSANVLYIYSESDANLRYQIAYK